MPHRRFAYWSAILLTLTGAFCAMFRYSTSGIDQALPSEDSWRVTYELEFKAEKAGAQIFIALPRDSSACRVFKSNIRSEKTLPSSEAHVKTTVREPSCKYDDREIKLTVSHPGEHQIVADLGIHSRNEENLPTKETSESPEPDNYGRYLASESGIQVKGKEVLATREQLTSDSASKSELLSRFFEYVHSEIETRSENKPEYAEQALRSSEAEAIGKARAMTALSRAAGIPARLVSGVELKETNKASAHFWMEAFVNGKWKPFDPENGYEGEIPHYYLVLRRSRLSFVCGTGITDLQTNISISEIHPAISISSAQLWPGKDLPLAEIFSLKRLPLELQPTLAVLLLFPLAALITTLFKTVIGIDTVGNFTPSLLALSFVYTGWQIGALLLFLVVSIGLLGRTLLERMKLLLLPRLSIVLTLVILGMILGLSIVDHFALTPITGLVLLPMVITTMIVERFYVAEEEEGISYSLQLLAGTVFVGFFCFLLLNWKAAGQLFLSYPELHFLTMAALILLGSYRGFRLSELWRFRDLQ